MFKLLKNYKKQKEEKKERDHVNRTKLAYELFTPVKQEKGDLLRFIKTFRDHSLIMLIMEVAYEYYYDYCPSRDGRRLVSNFESRI